MTLLDLPAPSLAEHSFASITAYTDEALFETCAIRIAFTERRGGVSTGPYASLNLGSRVDDDPQAVAENRMRLMQALAQPSWPLLVPKQVHGKTVLTLTSESEVESIQEQANQGADALTIAAPRVATLLCFADCVPVIAVSPAGIVSVIHAGWRGVENGIARCALEEMIALSQKIMGASAQSGKSSDLAAPGALGKSVVPAASPISAVQIAASTNVYIGPYIHEECFETGAEVHRRFTDVYGLECAPDKTHINLGTVLRRQFSQIGISDERVCDVDYCTVCNTDKFFSYRAQDGVAGRHGAFAVKF